MSSLVKFLLSFFLSSFFCYLPSSNVGLTPPGTYNPNVPVGQMFLGGATDCGPEHYTNIQGRASLNVWSARCQGHRRRQHKTENKQRTHTQLQDRNENF